MIKVDEVLWECLILNSDPDNDGSDEYSFDANNVAEYRKNILSDTMNNGKNILNQLVESCIEELEKDDMDCENDILSEMEDGQSYDRLSSYWNCGTDMTSPVILAKIPVKNPWEIFAYLPFGNWNECPNTLELMAVTKYWFEKYGAVPSTISHDELELSVSSSIPKEKAMELAIEQYGFCPDVLQSLDSVGMLADTLQKSKVWYFWGD